jgi:hypothetical protein
MQIQNQGKNLSWYLMLERGCETSDEEKEQGYWLLHYKLWLRMFGGQLNPKLMYLYIPVWLLLVLCRNT